jgi:SAM-dependent methyltransferase
MNTTSETTLPLPCDCCGSDGWTGLFTEHGIQVGRCPGCGLMSIESIPQPQLRMTEMEEGHYAGTKKVLDAGRQVAAEQVLLEQFRTYVGLARGFVRSGHWLDIGCGAGLLLSLAVEAGFTGEGLELNADRREIAAQVTGLPMHGAPVEAVHFPDDSFDVISMINVFSHLVSPAETLTEVRRILRPGGVLILATGEMGARVEKSHMPNWNLGDHLHFLGEGTMERYAQRLGWQIAHYDRAWFPDLLYSKASLRARGRSARRNAVKTVILRTPGAFPVFRSVMLRRASDSSAYSAVFALQPVDEPQGAGR